MNKGLGADSEEMHEPVSNIDTVILKICFFRIANARYGSKFRRLQRILKERGGEHCSDQNVRMCGG